MRIRHLAGVALVDASEVLVAVDGPGQAIGSESKMEEGGGRGGNFL